MEDINFDPYEKQHHSFEFSEANTVPRIVLINKAPTQHECLVHANERFEKEQKKGTIKKLDPHDNLLARNIARINRKNQRKLSEAVPMPKSEANKPILHRERAGTALPINPNHRKGYMKPLKTQQDSLETVIHRVMGMCEVWDSIFELERLPFKNVKYKKAVRKEFIKKLKREVTAAYNEGLESEIGAPHIKKLSKELERRLIIDYINDLKIDVSKLSNEIKYQFLTGNDFTNPQFSHLNTSNDDSLMRFQLGCIMDRLPLSYRTDITPNFKEPVKMEPESDVFIAGVQERAKTTPVSPREGIKAKPAPRTPLIISKKAGPVLSKPKVASKSKIAKTKQTSIFEMKHEQIPHDVLIKNYWSMFDPLKRGNEGADYAQQLTNIVDSVSFDFHANEEDFTEPFIDLPEMPIKKEENKEEKEDKYFITKRKTKLDEEIEGKESKEFVDRRNISMATRTKEDIKMLLKNDVINELLASSDDSLHDRLSKLWDELGFTVSQKLKMALKYSDADNASLSISESVELWENVLVAVKNYNQRYSDLKSAIRFSAGRADLDDSLTGTYFKELEESETAIKKFNSRLKNLSGDSILINGKSFLTVFAKRRKKLRKLTEEQY